MPQITVNSAITLPADMVWEDEFAWTPVRMKQEVSVTGALIIQSSKMQAGRPITIKSVEDGAWVTRAQLDALKALEETVPAPTFTLEMGNGDQYTVMFASTEGKAIEASPVQPGKEPSPDDYFVATLRFLEV